LPNAGLAFASANFVNPGEENEKGHHTFYLVVDVFNSSRSGDLQKRKRNLRAIDDE
jgi:hypothetical protein